MLKTSGISPFSRKKTSSISRKKHSFLFSKIKCWIESCFSSGKSSPLFPLLCKMAQSTQPLFFCYFFIISLAEFFRAVLKRNIFFYFFSRRSHLLQHPAGDGTRLHPGAPGHHLRWSGGPGDKTKPKTTFRIGFKFKYKTFWSALIRRQ